MALKLWIIKKEKGSVTTTEPLLLFHEIYMGYYEIIIYLKEDYL